MIYHGGEIRHHRDCVYYPESLTEMHHQMQNEIEKLQAQLAEAEKVISGAYKYLKATYDIHTWKDEPEYAMMETMGEYQRKYKGK